MTSSLRSRVVEAGARAVDPFMVHPLEAEDAAEAVLDAMLDCLSENADEWLVEAGGDPESDIDQRASTSLLAVLRNPN